MTVPFTNTADGHGRGRVCHLTSVHGVNDIRIFHKECTTLAAAGFDVTLVGVDALNPTADVNIVRLSRKGGRLLRVIKRARSAYLHALGVGAQIYHFHDPELLPYGLLLKRKTGARVIYDSHECFREDVVEKEWIPVVLRGFVKNSVGGIENYVVNRIDRVIAATSHIADSFAKRSVGGVITINNYPLENEFVRIQKSDNRHSGICYVGAISFVRGIIQFLDALSSIAPDIEVHVAGRFASDAVEGAVRAHPNWKRVKFHGQVDRSKVGQIYAACFAGVVTFLPAPNHVNSQPNKLFEYMAAGMAVIGSNFPLWTDVIKGGGAGIVVDPSNPSQLADAIQLLYKNKQLADGMGRQGARLVRERYNWRREGERLIETYDDLLAS